MIPLAMVDIGVKVQIVRIDGGRGLRSKLMHMGISEGEEIKVVSNHFGSLLISKGDVRYAVGRGMTHKVLVDEIKDDRSGQ